MEPDVRCRLYGSEAPLHPIVTLQNPILKTLSEQFGTLFAYTDRVAKRIRDDVAPKVAAVHPAATAPRTLNLGLRGRKLRNRQHRRVVLLPLDRQTPITAQDSTLGATSKSRLQIHKEYMRLNTRLVRYPPSTSKSCHSRNSKCYQVKGGCRPKFYFPTEAPEATWYCFHLPM